MEAPLCWPVPCVPDSRTPPLQGLGVNTYRETAHAAWPRSGGAQLRAVVASWAQHTGHSQPRTRTQAGGSPRVEVELRVWGPEPSWGRSCDTQAGSPLPPRQLQGSRVGSGPGPGHRWDGCDPKQRKVQDILQPGYGSVVLLLLLLFTFHLCFCFSAGSVSLSYFI